MFNEPRIERTITTKHNHRPNFGRHMEGCPRCFELKNGGTPISWGRSRQAEVETARRRAMDHHFASEQHRGGKCGPCCTYGEW